MADKNSELVGFVCQRCCQPIRLDKSFENDIDKSYIQDEAEDIKEEILNVDRSFNRYEEDEVDRLAITSNKSHKIEREASEALAKTFNQRIEVHSKLFDILSSQSDIDHPLCDECAGLLLDFLDQELEAANDDCRAYASFLDTFEKTEDDKIEDLQAELESLKMEERDLQRQLEEGEKEREALLQTRDLQKQEALKLDQEEEKFWAEYHRLEKERIEYENEDRSVDYQMLYAQVQIEKLKKTNIFNSAFHIWHKGHFGTINNFKLGRLPSVPVDWNEINAAWGQTVLLLHCLAKKINFTFSRYRLVPFGSYSFIESLSDKSKQLPLYSTGGIRFLWNTKFDLAMVAFLDCLQQFKEEVEKHDSGFTLPYKMFKGKIEDSSGSGGSYSIKTQFNSEDRWTKALKFMLTNLKWALAWVSSKCVEYESVPSNK